MPDEEFRPGAHDLETPFLFVPHDAPDPVEWKRRHPGWVSFPATFVPHPRPIPNSKVIDGQRWPLDKKGRPWPKTRYGRPTCPFDELSPDIRAPGTQVEQMRRLENPMLLPGEEPMPTVSEFSALAARLRAEQAAAPPPPPVQRPKAYDGDGPGPVRDYLDAMARMDWQLREFAAPARRERVKPENADAIRAGMDEAKETGGGVQVARLALPAAVPPPPPAVRSDAVPPAIGQVQLDRFGRRLDYVADEIARGELTDAAAHLLPGEPYPPEVDDPSPGGFADPVRPPLTPLSGFAPPVPPNGVEPGFDIDLSAGSPAVLVTPATPQVEEFDPPSVDPATVFERSELRRNMKKVGEIKDKDGRVAHHVVLGGGPMNGGRDASPTQRKLDELKIDRDGGDDGVALSPSFHNTVHTEGYCDHVKDRMIDVDTSQQAEDRPQEIGKEL